MALGVTRPSSLESSSRGVPRKLTVAASLLAIVASGVWIYHYEFSSSDLNVPLHQAVGHVMADETARVAGRHGKIVVVSMDTRTAPELKVQLAAFEKDL